MEILSIKNLSFSYNGKSNKVLNNASLDVNKGEILLLCGKSGSGKTTLLKLLKEEISPKGTQSGEIIYNEKNINELVNKNEIGFVFQNPEAAVVTDKVYHELAFSLENNGEKPELIRRRIAEVASYFNITDIFYKNTSELSGGEKQILSLASVVASMPKLILFDEPTSQLDPVAAEKFIEIVSKINSELGITVVIAEHRTEMILPYCDRVALIENGNIKFCAETDCALKLLKKDEYKELLPIDLKYYETNDKLPLLVKNSKDYLKNNYKNDVKCLDKKDFDFSEKAFSLKNVFFRYQKTGEDILKDVNLDIYKGEIISVIGTNGVGKTTLLGSVCGIIKPYSGSIKVFSKKVDKYKNNSLYKNCLTLLPQNPTDVFLKETVGEDLSDYCKTTKTDNLILKKITADLKIEKFLDLNPFDLSGGEQQICALAKVLLSQPKILLLDEPTKGIDAFHKKNLLKILFDMKKQGITIVLVTHDLEFSAECSDRCAFLSCGKIISADNADEFYSANKFYTTRISKVTNDFYDNAYNEASFKNLLIKNGGLNEK